MGENKTKPTDASVKECITGFASRKDDISVYLTAGGPKQNQLLEKLIKGSVAEVKKLFGE